MNLFLENSYVVSVRTYISIIYKWVKLESGSTKATVLQINNKYILAHTTNTKRWVCPLVWLDDVQTYTVLVSPYIPNTYIYNKYLSSEFHDTYMISKKIIQFENWIL